MIHYSSHNKGMDRVPNFMVFLHSQQLKTIYIVMLARWRKTKSQSSSLHRNADLITTIYRLEYPYENPGIQ